MRRSTTRPASASRRSPACTSSSVCRRGVDIPDVDEAAVERRVIDATRTWDEDLSEALSRSRGVDEGARTMAAYAKALPEAYKEDFDVETAVADLDRIEGWARATARPPCTSTPTPLRRAADERRFKLYRRAGLSLTQVLPLFTHLGVEVTDERPYEVRGPTTGCCTSSTSGCAPAPSSGAPATTPTRCARGSRTPSVRCGSGRAESDGFNALVLGAGLTWRQVVILRTVAKYLRQTGSTFSQDYVESALVANTGIARSLVDLFETRFDPDAFDDTKEPGATSAPRGRRPGDRGQGGPRRRREPRPRPHRPRAARRHPGQPAHELLPARRPTATTSPTSRSSSTPRRSPTCPAPRPMFEIWVYSPRVEGVHLRFGKVARGGLRWSDRREDFRTEVLGLVKAQMVKNAVIVPTGSKGGFYAKQLPDPAVDRAAWLDEGIAAYRLFISGPARRHRQPRRPARRVPPHRVVRHDEDDTYLVVAADKGTAKFSDIANGVSADYGFWLDDAFASGGSAGYDHKADGHHRPRARGSRSSGTSASSASTPRAQDFTVVGVGDMSGDVFGNGMLLSEHIRLVAAFDHRHIFVDPDPDAASSYAERAPDVRAARLVVGRLRRLARSRKGGGVFDRVGQGGPDQRRDGRGARPARRHEDADAGRADEGDPAAPVDLLWNGGIGTYVKAADRDQRARSATGPTTRSGSTARELRCKVVGEGGNLGLEPARPHRGGARAACASTPTPSTTAPASTPPTTRSTSRSCSPS